MIFFSYLMLTLLINKIRTVNPSGNYPSAHLSQSSNLIPQTHYTRRSCRRLPFSSLNNIKLSTPNSLELKKLVNKFHWSLNNLKYLNSKFLLKNPSELMKKLKNRKQNKNYFWLKKNKRMITKQVHPVKWATPMLISRK